MLLLSMPPWLFPYSDQRASPRFLRTPHYWTCCAHQQRRRYWAPPTVSVCVRAEAAPSASPSAPQDTQQPTALFDCVSLGNLCVDVVLQVETLPDDDPEERRQLLTSLSASPPDVSTWEVGGACNFMIAAARLGMDVGCIGQLGDDQPGQFLRQVMRNEGVPDIQPLLPPGRMLQQTLLCFVLVSPSGGHVFCSRYDFGPWPLLQGAVDIPQPVMQQTRALYLNGFVFDELEPTLVAAVARVARDAGAAVFFDPGPRCWMLRKGPRREALDTLLSLSDVVLMTEEEAAVMTGTANPQAAAQWLLERPGTATQWAVVKAGPAGALLYAREQNDRNGVFHAQAYQVDVRDTVGCGDSFAAAVVLGYLANHSVPTVMALANAVGAATAMGFGAGRNVATVSNVVNLLQASIDYTSSSEEDPCVHRQALQLLQDHLATGEQPRK